MCYNCINTMRMQIYSTHINSVNLINGKSSSFGTFCEGHAVAFRLREVVPVLLIFIFYLTSQLNVLFVTLQPFLNWRKEKEETEDISREERISNEKERERWRGERGRGGEERGMKERAEEGIHTL